MIPACSYCSREAAVAAAGRSDYFATETHYLSLANRIVAALRAADGSAVLVTGDPPPIPHLLSEALRKATLSRAAVVDIVCRADLTPEELSRLYSVVAALPPSSEEPAGSETGESARPIFVFAEADRLSDEQVKEVLRTAEPGGRTDPVALLVARSDFIARLESNALLGRQPVVARFELEDIGPDESIEFLRHQLAARQVRSEARGMPPGVLRGFAGSGVVLILGIGLFLFFKPDHLVGGPSAPPDPRSAVAPRSVPSETPMGTPGPIVPNLPPTALAPQAAPLPQPEPPRNAASMDAPATVSAPEPTTTPSTSGDQHRPSTEVAALVTRGDRFLSVGDITSARLFYERAADAGNAAAAMRLGATFDPSFLSRAGIRGIAGDSAQAASWYHRARDLGDPTAAERLKDLDEQPAGEPRAPLR